MTKGKTGFPRHLPVLFRLQLARQARTAGQYDHEFIAAHTRHEIMFAAVFPQAVRDHFQNLITG